MVVDTYTGIEGEPMADVLPKIDITGYFVLYFIDDVFTFSVSFTFDVTVLCFATEAVVVNSGSQAPGYLWPSDRLGAPTRTS